MRIEGIYTNNGKATIYVSQDPMPYFTDTAQGRSFQGKMTKDIYLGDRDISGLKIGSEIEVYYGEPVSTKNGSYAPIKKIEVLKG